MRDDPQMDPISAASAGMLAGGVPADQRAYALGVLSEMLDRADAAGQVKFDEGMFAVEQRLGVERCIDAYAWLEKTGVARRTRTGWSIKSIAAHRAPAGANAESMSVLARHLEENAAESGVVRDFTTRLPMPTPMRDVAGLGTVTPIGRVGSSAPTSGIRRFPVLAGSIAAAAALVVGVLSFSNQLQPPSDRDSDLASRFGTLPSAKPIDGTPEGASEVAGTRPAARVDGVPGSTAAALSGAAVSGPVCVLPRIDIVSVSFSSVPNLVDGTTAWSALVVGTLANVGTEPATIEGVEVAVSDGPDVIAQATTLLSTSDLAPDTMGTFTAMVPVGTAVPANPTAAATAINWKSASC